jgi:regulator of RNase E activity RraA
VPEERIEEVLQRIAAIVEKEKGIAEKVRSGAHIADLLGMSDAIAVSRSKGQTE